MLFSSAQFAVFLVVVLLVYRCVAREQRARVLLVASLLFYTVWIPVYLVLLLFDALVNWLLLQGMVRSKRPRLFVAASAVFTLGLLAYYKYAAMIVTTALPILGSVGLDVSIPEPLLPLGISFYSFQILALTIDVHRGAIEPVRSFSRYLLFVSFFPQLIAGPILRGNQILPQLDRGGAITAERTRRGLWLIGVGVAKKMILADALLAPFVDDVFEAAGTPSSPYRLIALYSFAFQIYYDFSGYTDMARGMACLMGFELPFNFKEPYLARNPSEFWRRWHITLSRWLSDYLYVPLGGNRRGPLRTYANLMLTMLLGGLWHGASWSFVVWGGLHGLLLVVHRRAARTRTDPERPLGLRDAPKILLTFHLVCLVWVFFRAPSFGEAFAFLGSLFDLDDPYGWPRFQVLVVGLCAALHVAERSLRLRVRSLQGALGASPFGAAVEGAALGAVLGVAAMVSGVGGDFIYFQF